MFNTLRRIALWFLLGMLLVGCTTTAMPSIAGTWGICTYMREDEHTRIFGTALACNETVRFLEDGTFLIYSENTIHVEKAVAQTRGTYKVLSAKQDERAEGLGMSLTVGEMRLQVTAPVSAKVRVSYRYQEYRGGYGRQKTISLTSESEHLLCQSCTLYKFITVATPAD